MCWSRFRRLLVDPSASHKPDLDYRQCHPTHPTASGSSIFDQSNDTSLQRMEVSINAGRLAVDVTAIL